MARYRFPTFKIFKYRPSAGGLLLFCLLVATIIANSPLGPAFHGLLNKSISITFDHHALTKTVHAWINDGLMSIFFFAIGLEVKREITGGFFSNFKTAVLPIGAAIGGMLVPGLIFVIINFNQPYLHAWGIPMATDIAIVLSILAIISKRVPPAAKIFIALVAIIDDLGSAIIIALFYTEDIYWLNITIAAMFFGVMLIMNIAGVRGIGYYGLVGLIGIWLAINFSGIHATISGVFAALAIPSKIRIDKKHFVNEAQTLIEVYQKTKDSEFRYVTKEQRDLLEGLSKLSYYANTPLQKFEYVLKPFVSFFILPLFALSSGGIEFQESFWQDLTEPLGLGIVLGLVLGKFAGISLFSRLMVKVNWAILPENMNWSHLNGLALLAGIGFTMSIFIAELAIDSQEVLNTAKSAIIVGSLIAGILAISYFRKMRN